MFVGLPRMHKEPGELRDFLPGFVSFLIERDVAGVVIEDGYGGGMGFRDQDYLRVSPKVKSGSFDDCMSQDIVVVIRAPDTEALKIMRPGAILLTMLHYSTQPSRNHRLLAADIRAVSLDSIVDDRGRRLVENISAVGWNALEVGFRELAHRYPGFEDVDRPPIQVTVLGSGAVAGAATFAAARYGDQDVHARMLARGVLGVEITTIDRDLTRDRDYMEQRLSRTDVLVDATRRPDPTKTIIPNAWLAWLPNHAVVVDLAADPYDFGTRPPIVKGIEGIPHGNLDHFVFFEDDPAYGTLSRHVETRNRRCAISSYSWPGVHPRACMEVYGAQLEPVMDVVLKVPSPQWDTTSSDHMERAIARAEVTTWHHMNRSR